MCLRNNGDFGHDKRTVWVRTVDMSRKTETVHDVLSNLFTRTRIHFGRSIAENTRMFDKIIGYERIKRTFIRSLNSDEPVHVLLIGPPGHAKTLFLKCILETFFTVGGNASKSGMMDVLFDMQPKYLLIDEIEHLKPEYQTMFLSLMETGILTQTISKKIRQTYLKTWVFATSNGTKKLSQPLLSRFRVMYLNEYEFSQFYEIAVKKLLADGLNKKAADEIAISVWEQLPYPNIRNCVQIGRLVKNEHNIEMAIADEI